MIGNRFLLGTLFGTIAGSLLACFFYAIENVTKIRLYSFLVNIDFLPLPSTIINSPSIQFILHIIIAILLVVFADKLCSYYNHPYRISFLSNVLLSFSFFPLYRLAVIKPFTSPLFIPFALWFVGHLIFAVIVGYFVSLMHKKKSAD
jgi:hypothetical protein